jgi:hypothetical protein
MRKENGAIPIRERSNAQQVPFFPIRQMYNLKIIHTRPIYRKIKPFIFVLRLH